MKVDTKTSYKERILKVLLYIQQNLYEDLSLKELSSIACFSPYHFHRVFKGMIGETLAEHIRRLKIEAAAHQLVNTDEKITSIAFKTGYETMESFTKAFKKHFKMTPSNYRKTTKEYRTSLPSFSFNKGVKMDVNVKKIKSRTVAFVRHIGPYNQCGSAWEKLCSWAGPKGLLNAQTQFVGLCYDDPEITEANKIRYDACITINKDIKAEGEIGTQEIQEGNYAVTIHKGPFENLKNTYAQLCGNWAPNSGKEIKNAPSIEVYLNDPEKTPPEELLVEIQMPIN